jgi:hypothetical protein
MERITKDVAVVLDEREMGIGKQSQYAGCCHLYQPVVTNRNSIQNSTPFNR